jgi:hypothetical protein
MSMDSEEDKARYYAVMDWYDLERQKSGIDLIPIIKKRLLDDNADARGSLSHETRSLFLEYLA